MSAIDQPDQPSLWGQLTHAMPGKRKTLKWMHWCTVPLIVWFTFVTPDNVTSFGPGAFHFHSFLGLVFVSVALGWTVLHLRRGLVGRPGPKLGPRIKVFHQILHKTLIWGLFGVAVTGFFLGLTSTVQLWAGGLVPIGVPLGLPWWNDLTGTVHIIEFYALVGLVIGHAGFHIWRHLHLRDNALRIMFPRVLHRYL